MELILYILFFNKFMLKTIWCFQNFLTMEFYRKICNKCYWSNIYNSRHSFIKQSLIIAVSFLPLMFLSFFYMPTDPANSNKSSFILRTIKFITFLRVLLGNSFNKISDLTLKLLSSPVYLAETCILKNNPVRLNTVLLI